MLFSVARDVLRLSTVKIQLTKDKAIELNLPVGGGLGKSKSDIVGVELFSKCAQGCPAVRLLRKKDGWLVSAADYIKPPQGELPTVWEGTLKQPKWELPRVFQAPSAAIAVNTGMGLFAQASPEAIIQEMANGPAASSPSTASAPAAKRKFGIKRAEPAPKSAATESQPSNKQLEVPEPGNPVSENGRRFSVRPFAEDGFRMYASIPEFQALWISRLLPEGKRPTACSIQLSESALMASILSQPCYKELGGTMMAVFVSENAVFFAGYKGGVPVLWRRCPNVGGLVAMREAVKRTFGVTDDLVNDILDDSLVDPHPALEPFVHPILEQLELSRAYLTGKHEISAEKIILMGIDHGIKHWRGYAEEALRVQFVAPSPFEGMQFGKTASPACPNDFLVAIGAAIAAAEVES